MVPEIKRILFATDLSKNSRHAFNYAVSAADRYGATITILHVMEEISPFADRHLRSFIGEESWQELQKKPRTRSQANSYWKTERRGDNPGSATRILRTSSKRF